MPTEVASQFFAREKALTSDNGKFEGFQEGTRTIAGVTYPTLSVRFTPSAGAPVYDDVDVLVFPDDYAQRRRFYIVTWFDVHSATAQADGLFQLDDAVAGLSLRPLGTVVARDDFQNADGGLLSNTNPDPDHYLRGYVDGEYMLQKVDGNWDRTPSVVLSDALADTTVAVDVYFASDTAGQYVELGCRRKITDPGNTGYFLIVSPDRGFRFGRNDDGTVAVLVDWRQSPAIPQGSDPMHVELTCAEATMTGSVNGGLLGSVDDSKYREGRLLIGASAPTGSTADARFQKLLVTQH